ncbi:glycosyltransferase 87 family protein [Embleya sp. NPDC059237]|uniref:glycosyltransferase 87 family protein n=1 Tax=Embleya sp. NPDC059237 TaxID=3346784 RepID=UPI003693B5C2
MKDDGVCRPTVASSCCPRLKGFLALVVLVVGFAGVAFWSWWSAWHLPSWDRQMDLHVYIGAVRTVGDGRPLYDYAAENGDPFTYPPFALMAFWPLGWVSEPVARILWTLATLAAVIGIVAAMVVRHGTGGGRRHVMFTLLGASILAWSAPLQSNLRFGQVSIFLVLLTFVDALDLTPRPLRGILVGAAAAIKLTPLLFVPYLWLTGRRRDALRAGTTFAACTGLAHLLWPSTSTTFWSDAIFSTSRIGNLAATGNQSLNGALIRVGVVPPERTVAWLALSALTCFVALIAARQCHREGRSTQGVIVVGCATVAASPVSWTHHQVWLVLGGLLLVTGPRVTRMCGAVVLVVMTFSMGAWLPGSFVRENVRLFAGLALSTWGLASLWGRGPRTVGLLPGVRLALRPRTAMICAAFLAVAAVGVLVVVREPPVVVRFETQEHGEAAQWDPRTNECMSRGAKPNSNGTLGGYGCFSAVDPAGGTRLNFGVSKEAPDGVVRIQGQVGPDVKRLMFIPVEGTKPLAVPLLRKPEPSNGPDTPHQPGAGIPKHSTPPGTNGAGGITGLRSFSIVATNTDHARLLAYGEDGRLLSQQSDKLREY